MGEYRAQMAGQEQAIFDKDEEIDLVVEGNEKRKLISADVIR